MMKDKIYGVRDPYGNRPLCIGKIVPINLGSRKCNKPHLNSTLPYHKIHISESAEKAAPAEGWVVSSESCGFLSIGARYEREVQPGEIIEITQNGVRTIDIVEPPENKRVAFCIFEYVYFARSDSMFEGQMVYSVRLQCGRELSREAFVDADIVSSVPESGTAAAHGFAREVSFTHVYKSVFSTKIILSVSFWLST